jgi:asparagine synthase (glutamine-hydrolysing)
MSGIAGIIHFDGAPIEPGQIEKMTTAIAHRGPDGIHHWVKGAVALGQCMLRTTPESLEEIQPLTNENESLVLVMDGRVDNWEELRRDLLGRGAVLRTRADAELVLRAYEVWGKDCLPHIDGDFALVIWDARQRSAFCARDRMGNKPFHYHWDGRTLAFASELHAILALPWVREEPNEGMLAEYLAWDFHSRDETLWQGVMRLVAAHRMEVNAGGPRIEEYWAPDLWATLPYTRDEEYIEHYRELFTDAVRRMSRTHRPLACEASGGLDSSAIFCMAEHLRRSGSLPAPGVEGYTVAFTDDSEANELAYARAVGEFLGVAIHEIPPTVMPLDWYEESAQTYREFPGFPNGAMGIGLRQQAAVQGSRVLFTGEWGDAWLQGSRAYYAEELSQRHWHALYDCFRTDAAVAGTKQAASWFVREGIFPLLPPPFQQGLRRLVRKMRGNGHQRRDSLYWLSPAIRETIEQRRKQFGPSHTPRVHSIGQRELLDMLYCAFSSQVMDQIEHTSAQAGLETRHPFSDPRIVQHAFSTPERLRLRGDQTKYIHVQAMQGLMPQTVLDRKSKAEFSIVFRSHLDGMKDILTDNLPRERPDWVTHEGIARLYRLYQDNPQFGWPLWVLWGIHGCDSVFMKG